MLLKREPHSPLCYHGLLPGRGIEPRFQWVLTLPPASPNSPGIIVSSRKRPRKIFKPYPPPEYRPDYPCRSSSRGQYPEGKRKEYPSWRCLRIPLMTYIPYHILRNFVNTRNMNFPSRRFLTHLTRHLCRTAISVPCEIKTRSWRIVGGLGEKMKWGYGWGCYRRNSIEIN